MIYTTLREKATVPSNTEKILKLLDESEYTKIVYDNYKNNPKKFVDRLYNMGLHKILDIPIKGEGVPKIPYPTDKNWTSIEETLYNLNL